MTELTPYDTGARLEPKLWVNPVSIDRAALLGEDYGKVDFDNDEGATEFVVHAEREGEGYVLHIDNLSETPLRVEGVDELVQPSEELQRRVTDVIDNLPTETERMEAEVFWQERQALVLVGGEKHYRKQQAIMVYANRLIKPSSAIVKSWADGVRDTRIG